MTQVFPGRQALPADHDVARACRLVQLLVVAGDDGALALMLELLGYGGYEIFISLEVGWRMERGDELFALCYSVDSVVFPGREDILA